ncbi:MAG: ribonuclease Z [Deltaproteobacteria bacterium]|nr:MAG: ribonuclease Z [Deltaproteobacteria bacterium]
MTPLFLPQLVNDPFGDPAVYLQIRHEKTAVLFDLGDLSRLPTRKLMKIDYIFVSHCHMDHFIGFDRLLRCVLGRQKNLHIFGPPGILHHVQGKLAGYTWNLVENYPLSLTVSEIQADQQTLTSQTLLCRDGFRETALQISSFSDHTILSTTNFSVQAVILDHKIPCAAYSFQEPFHLNFRREVLEKQGWARGPWLTELRKALRRGLPEDTGFTVSGKTYTLKELKDLLIIITPGQKIGYVTDIHAGSRNFNRVAAILDGCDILFCEAAFLDDDCQKAEQTCHLTASQAGRLAREARAKKLVLFHFSPKNHGRQSLYYQEASRTFSGLIS